MHGDLNVWCTHLNVARARYTNGSGYIQGQAGNSNSVLTHTLKVKPNITIRKTGNTKTNKYDTNAFYDFLFKWLNIAMQ